MSRETRGDKAQTGVGITARRRSILPPLLLAVALAVAGVDVASADLEANQARMNSFYDLHNLLTVRITMPEADWVALRDAQPRGGTDPSWVGSRFDWHQATSVTIETTQFPQPNGSFTFNNVGMRKKSWLGSFSTTKPAFHLKYDEYDDNEAALESLIGTKRLMLNNAVQDPDYIRQCLGYKLFRDAGLPASRCNFAHVYVNGTDLGVYVNVEPIEKPYVANNFAGNQDGNLYEFDLGEDFDPGMLWRIDWEGFSPYADKEDLQLASVLIAIEGYDYVIDVQQFIRLWAMEILLKHWDGYTGNKNNIHVYNDVNLLARDNTWLYPALHDVKFKFIPYGIDQILQPWQPYTFYQNSILASRLAAHWGYNFLLRLTVYGYLDTVFNPTRYTNDILPYINSAVGVVNTLLSQAVQGPVNTQSVNDIAAQLAGLRQSMDTLFSDASLSGQ